MPTFCRHNRLVQNCTICAREQNLEVRPVLSSGAPKVSQPRERSARAETARTPRTPKTPRAGGRRAASSNVRVRRLTRGLEDEFRSPLVPGLKSSQDTERLAAEIAFSTWRLELMARVAAGDTVAEAPASWSELLGSTELEARTTLAIGHVLDGPRGAGEGVGEALEAFRAWGARSGSISAALTGEDSWTAERRFERIFERLQFGGLSRDTRFELLTLLGGLRLYELRPARLFLVGENEATWAAKRAFGIGDPLLLERRAADLAAAAEVPLGALDLALHNWGAGERVTDGLPEQAQGDEPVLERARSALGL